MATTKLVMHKKDNGKHVAVGSINVFVPELKDLGWDVEVKELDDDGLPVYADAKAQFAQDALTAAVKAQARSKLLPGTITLRDGSRIATSVSELLEVGRRGGNGEALAFIRDLKVMFAKWVAGTGKSETVQKVLTTLFANRAALSLQSESVRTKFAGYLGDFSESLEEDVLEKAENYLQSLLDICNSDVSEEEI